MTKWLGSFVQVVSDIHLFLLTVVSIFFVTSLQLVTSFFLILQCSIYHIKCYVNHTESPDIIKDFHWSILQ